MPDEPLAQAPAQQHPPKNIILLSDGTGNSAAKVWRTNVWRVFESLDLTNSRQVAIYDDGVGSSSFKLLALLGGAFGWGLKRNVLDLYTFLCRNYEPNDKIYAFGFSRGAFTMRVLIGLIDSQGLLPLQPSTTEAYEAQLRRDAKAAYRAYRRARYKPILSPVVTLLRSLRDMITNAWNTLGGYQPYHRFESTPRPPIRFVGLWDTVAAYGLPIEEMTRSVSLWIWPMSLPDCKLSALVERACHALSLDDERTTFHPVLWSEEDTAPPPRADGHRYIQDERISQVWFAGVHANVGGGYPDDSLSHVPLYWIMNEARLCGLRFKVDPPADPDALRRAKSALDMDGRLYNSRHGLAGYYRYGPRKLQELCNMRLSLKKNTGNAVTIPEPKIHASVFKRIIHGAHAYAPIGLPERYAVVTDTGQILDNGSNPYETAIQAKVRSEVQEHVWNLVWRRRVVYFATLFASLWLAAFPLFHLAEPEVSSRLSFLSPLIRLAGVVLPGFARWWIDAFAANPGWFVLYAAIVALCMWDGARLETRITDKMGGYWRTILQQDMTPAGALPHDWIYRLRMHPWYRTFIWALKWYILPTAFALVFFYIGLSAASRVSFTLADSFGFVCQQSPQPESPGGTLPATGMPQSAHGTLARTFDTSALCWGSGMRLEKDSRYRITMTVEPGPWSDGRIETDLGGFSVEKMTWPMYAALPLRRTLAQPWFKPIARIGPTGNDEYPLEAVRRVGRDVLRRELVAELTARTTGELFLYVNDAVLGLPGLYHWFYVGKGKSSQNVGTAQIKVETVASSVSPL
jgi:uncharacterized protein (DUF2235 family)